ncbi:hypothetical protein NP233_g10490 [Leucocoprinus birnbaumii]|uniref:Uncharacterized protein n=1 Tax=Leucocoprinus birnbaumii TaxID=56174 RepID=A0AAD5VID4_9AGAR|nr:hypothetical protein NP233_g10490 [Leucocoprinus birnbaumii]
MRSLSLILYVAIVLPVLSSPVRRSGGSIPALSATDSGNSYSGAGGTALGGSVRGNENTGLLGLLGGDGSLLNIGSSAHILRRVVPYGADSYPENAGTGGDADSGASKSSIGGGRGGGKHGWSHSGSHGHGSSSLVNSVNSYSGAGGNANGGDIESPGGLINLWSENGGDGGSASSGSSKSLIRAKD